MLILPTFQPAFSLYVRTALHSVVFCFYHNRPRHLMGSPSVTKRRLRSWIPLVEYRVPSVWGACTYPLALQEWCHWL